MGLNNPGGIKGAVKTYPCSLTNGDFETGDFTGWTYVYAAAVVSNGAYEGTYYANIEADYGLPAEIRQTLICNAADHVLTFHYYLIQYSDIRMIISGPGFSTDQIYSAFRYVGNRPYDVWLTDAYIVPSAASYGTVTLRFFTYVEYTYIDDYIKLDGVTLTK